jgi:hypothetical protein
MHLDFSASHATLNQLSGNTVAIGARDVCCCTIDKLDRPALVGPREFMAKLADQGFGLKRGPPSCLNFFRRVPKLYGVQFE